MEDVLLRPIRDELLAPERVAKMAEEMRQYCLERLREMQVQLTDAPAELQELAARIERLRERVRQGDRDMTAEDLQTAIERAEARRRELQVPQVGLVPSAAFSAMRRAAELYRRQVALGLDGQPQAVQKARVFLREWFGGRIGLEPLPDGGLIAHWNQNVGALLARVGSFGSGGVIPQLLATLPRRHPSPECPITAALASWGPRRK